MQHLFSLSHAFCVSVCMLPDLYQHYQQGGRRQISGWANLALPLTPSSLRSKLAAMWVGSDFWCLLPTFSKLFLFKKKVTPTFFSFFLKIIYLKVTNAINLSFWSNFYNTFKKMCRVNWAPR